MNAVVRYASGRTGVIQASTAFWPGYTERIEFHGTKGTAIISGDKLTAWDVQDDSGDPPPLASEVASGASDPMAISLEPFERQFLDFGEAIRRAASRWCPARKDTRRWRSWTPCTGPAVAGKRSVSRRGACYCELGGICFAAVGHCGAGILVFPPLGLALWWMRRGVRPVARIAGTLAICVVAIVELFAVYGMRLEWNGALKVNGISFETRAQRGHEIGGQPRPAACRVARRSVQRRPKSAPVR